MAQLDRLIGALLQHSADSLILVEGERPALRIGGTDRPIVKSALTADHVRSLVSEIAPPAEGDKVALGLDTSFAYTGGGATVLVEMGPGPRAVISVQHTPAPATPRAAEIPRPPASPPAAAHPVPSAPPVPTAHPAPPAASSSPATVPPAGLASERLSMDRLFVALVEGRGSDLHLSSEAHPMIRVDGDLGPLPNMPRLDAETVEKMLLQIAPPRNVDEFKAKGDTDFAYQIRGLCRFRCNLFRDRKGAGGVFRAIPSKILTSEDLGLSQSIRNLCQLSKGLVLVTGPTGSGKSTTLCALIDEINSTRRDHVITIEDPIEFVHESRQCLINQREVHLHTQSFKAALRAALREDPDIVLVGELRDLETIAIALETAETGHLVFGTLHTSSAISTVDRIIDQFPGDQQPQIRIMLSESLKAVIAQALCKKIGGGRVAALEVLMANPAVSNLIREGKTFQIPSIMQTGRKLGMIMLNDALLELCRTKTITPEEAYLKSVDKSNLESMLKAKGFSIEGLGAAKAALPSA